MTLPTHHIDINQLDFIADPYAQLSDLRDQLPVFHDEVWHKIFFTRYADIVALLKDKRLGRTMLHILSREELGWPPPNPRLKDFYDYQDNVFMDWEPPAHTRIRSLVSKVFTPRRVDGLRSRLENITHSLIDRVQQNGSC
nr:cytochrome P450 [Chloroflexota bacterium]